MDSYFFEREGELTCKVLNRFGWMAVHVPRHLPKKALLAMAHHAPRQTNKAHNHLSLLHFHITGDGLETTYQSTHSHVADVDAPEYASHPVRRPEQAQDAPSR